MKKKRTTMAFLLEQWMTAMTEAFDHHHCLLLLHLAVAGAVLLWLVAVMMRTRVGPPPHDR